MANRVTIVIDDDIDKKLRFLQAKTIQKTHSNCSFSKILNETLRKALK